MIDFDLHKKHKGKALLNRNSFTPKAFFRECGKKETPQHRMIS